MFLLKKKKKLTHFSKHAGLRQRAWAEPASPPVPSGSVWRPHMALLTCGVTSAPVCPRPTTPTSRADYPVDPFCGLMFMSAESKFLSPKKQSKCNTFAMFLLRISLKVWTLFDQMIGTAKKLWQPVGNFFSTIICVYPDKKEKGRMVNIM